MRTLFLSTSSNETTKYLESLECLKLGPCEMLRYDSADQTEANMYSRAKESKPDLIVYIGGVYGKQPATSTLARINAKIAPMVHLCSDAADAPWWALLREYHLAGCFTLQVAIDGNLHWPLADSQLTLLTPINPAHFNGTVKPHAEREYVCGWAGNAGSEGGRRRAVLTELMLRNLLRVRMRSGEMDTYDAMCAFLGNCRMSLNISWSGTEQAHQVKGRVIETGLAAGVLLEIKGSPTAQWFTPGVDYLEYSTMDELIEAIKCYELQLPSWGEEMGKRLQARVLAEHHPRVFWGKILERIGLES